MPKSTITQALLKEVLHYNPDTGHFRWLVASGRRAVVGAVAGHLRKDGYIHIGILGKIYKAHRLAFLYMTGDWPLGVTDHSDNNKDNNAWSNLRDCSITENMQNRKLQKNNTSGSKGVHFRKDIKKWTVQVSDKGIQRHLGFYVDKEVADLVATEARELYHGMYARHA